MDIESQTAYYNRLWENVGFANSLKLARCIAILDRLYSFDLRSPKICDLGSGSGWLTNILNTFGPTTGVELSDVAVKTARQLYSSCDFICADITSWEFAENSFDVVVSQEVIEHFEKPEQYFNVACALLQPGGYLILTTPNAATVMAREAAERSNQPVENWLTLRQVKRLFKSRLTAVRAESFVPNYGSSGMHKIWASNKIRNTLGSLGVREHWERLACLLGFGLHILASGRRSG